jgi:hypothetical protein
VRTLLPFFFVDPANLPKKRKVPPRKGVRMDSCSRCIKSRAFDSTGGTVFQRVKRTNTKAKKAASAKVVTTSFFLALFPQFALQRAVIQPFS